MLNPSSRIQSLIANVEQRGWSLLSCEEDSPLCEFKRRFEDIVASVAGRIVDGSPQETIRHLNSSQLMKLSITVNYQLIPYNFLLFAAFRDSLRAVCGDDVYLQRRVCLRANVPDRDHTATPAHSDVFYGHSPYAYTLWIPLYDVLDDSGIYIFDRQKSDEILSDYKFDKPLEDSLSNSNDRPASIRVRYGEAILFQCGLVHGAYENRGRHVRVSLDTRVQPRNTPLFEKHFDLYSLGTLK